MKLLVRLAIAASIAAALAFSVALACGPHYMDLVSIRTTRPADLERFGTGTLGIVRPSFERALLAQTYRVATGQPALPALARPLQELREAGEAQPHLQWSVIPGAARVTPDRYDKSSHQYLFNCLDDAFASAVRTHAARVQRYGWARRSEIRPFAARKLGHLRA